MQRVFSIYENGGQSVKIDVETSLSNGLPGMTVIGFGGKSLDEAKERIRSAFAASSIPLPRKRITVNISPSDIPKDGAHFDLAIALSIMHAAAMIPRLTTEPIVLGELGLDGTIRPVRGILGKIIAAKKQKANLFILPEGNKAQAALIHGIDVHFCSSLKILYDQLNSEEPQNELYESVHSAHAMANNPPKHQLYPDFRDVIGQQTAKRALEIAAAGGHNIMLSGPPGVGKSMLAKAMTGILSAPDPDEVIAITHLHSLHSHSITDLVRTRPFRSPHHSASDVSLIGGGQNPRPGEVSLAHGGVLFLDELPEFKKSAIESLRQPLEDGFITVARAKNNATYPARFMLVATQNPCPCGYYGSSAHVCRCTPVELHRYQKKLSGPILDRIDMHVTVDNINHEKLLSNSLKAESSSQIQKRVSLARQIQIKRYPRTKTNAALSSAQTKKLTITPEAKELLDTAASKLNLSARVYMKTVKVARTIADLDGKVIIEKNNIAEALQYRPKNNSH